MRQEEKRKKQNSAKECMSYLQTHWILPSLFHVGINRGPHIHFVYLVLAVDLLDEWRGGLAVGRKCRVRMQRVPVRLGGLAAGVIQQVHEGVFPCWIFAIRQPISDGFEAMFGL